MFFAFSKFVIFCKKNNTSYLCAAAVLNMKKLLIILLFLTFASVSRAETETDFSTWITLNISKSLSDKFSLGFLEEFRSKDHIKKTDYWITRVSVSYRTNKWLSMMFAYDYLCNKKYGATNGTVTIDNFYRNIHRLVFDVIGNFKASQFKFNLRARYIFAANVPRSISYVDAYGTVQDWEYVTSLFTHHLRPKVKISYSIPKTPLSPYVSDELFVSRRLEQSRLCAGFDIKTGKITSMSIYYMWQYKKNLVPKFSNHVIGLSYSIKL